jgi:hypothetical protein
VPADQLIDRLQSIAAELDEIEPGERLSAADVIAQRRLKRQRAARRRRPARAKGGVTAS